MKENIFESFRLNRLKKNQQNYFQFVFWYRRIQLNFDDKIMIFTNELKLLKIGNCYLLKKKSIFISEIFVKNEIK